MRLSRRRAVPVTYHFLAFHYSSISLSLLSSLSSIHLSGSALIVVLREPAGRLCLQTTSTRSNLPAFCHCGL